MAESKITVAYRINELICIAILQYGRHAMMLENLAKVQRATQGYIDTIEKVMRGLPGANENQITTFKAYLERQVAANRDFVEKLLRAMLSPKILIESRAPSNLLALAEAQLGVAIIPSVVMTHRYDLRVARITHDRKLLGEPLSIVWDNRRALPRYAQDFAKLLAAHMRERGDAVSAKRSRRVKQGS